MSQVYFNNIEQTLMLMLASAKNRIYVAVAWFTNKRLSEELINALKRNVKVKVLLLNDILNRSEFGIDFGVLATNGAEIRFANSKIGTMHNKFCVIDDKVITGSYNWTYHANVNDENVIEIDEVGVVNNYCVQFEVLFNSGELIKKPYEYLKWIDVKEGDFYELRRNLYRDVIANGTEYRELQKTKLINLDHAYKSGNPEDLARASSLPIEESLRTITDVLVSRSQDFVLNLWEENNVGKPFDDTDGHIYFGKWYYIPYEIKEDKYHYEYIYGTLKTNACRDDIVSKGLKLKIYDKNYIETIKKLLCSQPLSSRTRKLIPDKLLRIDFAKMCFYQFPSPMYNKSQPKTWRNTPRTIPAINLLAIAKEVSGDNAIFYNGWDPQIRGKKIMKELFVKV